METNNIPYFAHEGMMARMERTIRRLWILALVLVVLLVASNAAWLWYNSQFETIEYSDEYSYEAHSDRGHAIINGDGEVNINGELRPSDTEDDN